MDGCSAERRDAAFLLPALVSFTASVLAAVLGLRAAGTACGRPACTSSPRSALRSAISRMRRWSSSNLDAADRRLAARRFGPPPRAVSGLAAPVLRLAPHADDPRAARPPLEALVFAIACA